MITVNLASIAFFATYVQIFEKDLNLTFIFSNLFFLGSIISAILVVWPGLICIGRLMEFNRFTYQGNDLDAKTCERQAIKYEDYAANTVLLSLGLFILGIILFFAYIAI